MTVKVTPNLGTSPYQHGKIATFRHHATSGIARRAMVFALSLAIGGCAIVQPYVKMPPPTSDAISFREAKTTARQSVADFNTKLEELEYFDFATGTMLVGAGIAALAFGIYNAHEDAIFGAALAGGIAVAGRSFLPIQTRKEIYQSGTQAIGCAIASISLGEPDEAGVGGASNDASAGGVPVATARESLDRRVGTAKGPLSRAAARLRALSNPVGAAPGAPILGSDARATTSDATANLRTGRRASVSSARALFASAAKEKDPVARFSGSIAATRVETLDRRLTDAQTAAKDLSAAVDQAVATRGQRLLLASEAIVVAVNAKLVAARITPEDSLKLAISNFTATHTDIKSIAKSLTEKAEDAKEKGEDAIEAITTSAAAAPQSDLAAKANEIQPDVEKKEKKAEELQTTAAYVLSLVEASDTCLNGLK